MKRRKISMGLVIIMLATIIHINPINQVLAAAPVIKWNKNDTLDTALQVIQNKAGDEDVLLELDMEEAGNYSLEYYLDDLQRTTVSFHQQYDKLVVGYRVDQFPGVDASDNITPTLAQNFLEMDYSLTVPDWKYIQNKPLVNDEVQYTILKNASSRYPGVAFEISNVRVIIKWDFQANKVYFLTTDYNQGTIMPVAFTNPFSQVKEIKVLKGLEDFKVTPTHLIIDGAVNKEATISQPEGEKPGTKPGLQITFKQPSTFKEADWTYNAALSNLSDLKGIVEVSDIGVNGGYMDFNFDLIDSVAAESGPAIVRGLINEVPNVGGINDGVQYTFDVSTQTYKIDIVKGKTELALQTEIIQWEDLESSKIYNVNIDFQKEAGFDGYEFKTYLPESKFAYTYMEYELKRANMAEAYLDIKPYDVGSQAETEYKILYSKNLSPQLDIKDDLWLRHYYSKQGSDSNIFIPVPFEKNSSQDVYQVVVDFSGTALTSQVLNYKAKLDLNVPTTTPRIEKVDRLFVVPPEDTSNNPLEVAQFDLIWTAPDNKATGELGTILSNEDNRIYYEILINDLPTETDGHLFKVIKVFEAYKEDNQFKVKLHESLTGSETPAGGNYNAGYSVDEELFRMDNITIFDDFIDNGEGIKEWTEVIDTIANEDDNEYTITPSGVPYDFNYPGINYIRIRAITMIDNKIGISYPSIPISLSLSPTEYDVPIAGELKYKPFADKVASTVGISLDWHSVDIESYKEYMLSPVDKVVDELYYGVYISQDRQKILDLNLLDGDLLNPNPLEYEYTLIDRDPIVRDITLTSTEQQALRADKVLFYNIKKLDDLTLLKSEVEGLDENTNYYIRIVTKLKLTSNEDIDYTHYKMSDASAMLSVTTPTIIEVPNEDEIKPLSVENLEASFLDDALISAKISWTYPLEISLEKDKFAFEIFSIEDKALPDELKSGDIMLEDLFEDSSLQYDNLEMWRVYVEEINGEDTTVFVKYNKETDNWAYEDSELISLGNHSVEILDTSNTPNRVYYYYVRTINVTSDADTGELVINAASSWQLDTLTTAPIKGPINLTVSYNSGYPYDFNTQSIIRFDAPIPDDAVLDHDYGIEVFVKGEDDDDYSDTKYPAIRVGEDGNGDIGYRRLYYKITKLKPGKAYSVKVRIEDRTIDMEVLPGGALAYPKSAFSERIIVRTEFDQGEYDKETKFKEYLDYYDLKVSDIEKNPYYTLEKTSTKNVVKYKEDYGIGELQLNKNGTYTLATEDLKVNVIYLPSKFVEAANEKKVILKIEANDQTINIRPYSLGRGITKAINEKADEILKVNSSVVDYYVKITIDNTRTSTKINSKTPASVLVDIKVDVVGSKKLELLIDQLMSEELKTIISFKRASLKEALTSQLNLGIDEKKMLSITKDAVEDVKTNFSFAANLVMTNNIEKTSKAVISLAKNMLLIIKPTTATSGLQMYKKTGSNWSKQEAIFNSSKYSLETMDLATYVLLPYEMSGTSLAGKYTSEEIDVINKYSLYEIFNSSELASGSLNLQKYRMIPAFARLLGAPSGSDDSKFLKDHGIIFNTNNMYSDLSRGEILYLHTQVFAKKYNIKLSNVKIQNYNIITDISKVNETYKNTLLIGANMGMYKLTNGMVLPDNKLTIKEFIELLTKIDKGLN
ncbi:MAG: hypothetical protein CVV02_06380 [Firmicutes bacterium HGW-Firmicutes-7]|nr:MAG: hypothetical protein CVV02_06380 [Firmicutes bacterium HGW-Firmicutes-7]